VSGVLRSPLQGLDDHRLDPVITDGPWPARARLVEQAVKTLHDELVTPLRHLASLKAQLRGHHRVRRRAATVSAPQVDRSVGRAADLSASHRPRMTVKRTAAVRPMIVSIAVRYAEPRAAHYGTATAAICDHRERIEERNGRAHDARGLIASVS
jgi:hypothetical protein